LVRAIPTVTVCDAGTTPVCVARARLWTTAFESVVEGPSEVLPRAVELVASTRVATSAPASASGDLAVMDILLGFGRTRLYTQDFADS